MTLFAGVDLETTGLEPGLILEIGCVVFDQYYDVKDEFHALIKPACFDDSIFRTMMNDFVFKMHTDNGLLADIAQRGRPHNEVYADFYGFLAKHKPDDGKFHFLGNSIASLDLPFLKSQMPNVFKNMHYRSVDISGLRIDVEVATGRDYKYPKAFNHRGLADVYECIKEMKYINKQISMPRLLLDDALAALHKYEGDNGRFYNEILEQVRALDNV